MDKKVFVLTAGDYSDYHIVGVFSTRAKAEAEAKVQEGADEWERHHRVEEYGLNMWESKKARGYKFYHVRGLLHEDIVLMGAEPQEEEQFYITKRTEEFLPRFIAYFWAKSEKHAIKIASDKKRQLIAEGGGV